jgi:hypothetical protein
MRFELRAALIACVLAASQARAQGTQRAFDSFTPGACFWVSRLVQAAALRDKPDTTSYYPAKDSTIALARDSVRFCSSAYSTPSGANDLLDEARIRLVAGDDAVARTMAQRYLATLADSSAEQKAWALHLLVETDLRVRPRRFSDAVQTLAELDKLGPKAARASVMSHLAFAAARRDSWDDSSATAEASAAIAKWKTLSPEDALDLSGEATRAFLMKAEIAMRTSSGDAARAIVDTAQRTIPSAAAFAKRQLEAARRLYGIVGKKAEPIVATYWFNISDPSASRPALNKVTVILEASHACGSACRPRYRALARLNSRFGTRGLEIISFTKTVGYYREVAPVTPAEEAKYDSTFFLVTRQLPGALAVFETKFRWLPDGRRINEPTPQDRNYPLATLIIVDRRGSIRYAATGWDPVLEEPLAKLIEKLLTENAAPGGP